MNARIPLLLIAGITLSCRKDPGTIVDPGPQLDCSIPERLLFQGQVRDAIPSLTNPGVVEAANSETAITDDSRVLGLVINGKARAYPLAILRWHEIANDTLGGEQILVSYCPLTASGLAFDPHIDGVAKNFGVSGLLFENNLVMYDRQTESLWVQLLLGSQCGPERGKSLERIPVVEATWGYWKELYPETTILNFQTGFFDRDYRANPYADYMQNDEIFFPSAPFSTQRDAKELAFGAFNDSTAVVFPFGELGSGTQYGLRSDVIGDTPFLVTFLTDEQTAFGFDRRVNGDELTFSMLSVADRTIQDAETGSTWDRHGVAIDGPLVGERLAQLEDAFTAYWFAWSVYYPDLKLVF